MNREFKRRKFMELKIRNLKTLTMKIDIITDIPVTRGRHGPPDTNTQTVRLLRWSHGIFLQDYDWSEITFFIH